MKRMHRSKRRDLQFWASELFDLALPGLLETTSPRTWAFSLLGVCDYLERLRRAGIPTRQIASVQVWSRRIGLTMSKLPDRGKTWLAANERRFEHKWGWVPPPTDPDGD